MRIAFLTTEFGDLGRERGGLGYHLARAVPLLAARGHECEVFLSSGARDDAGSAAATHQDVLVHRPDATGPTPFDDLDLPRQVEQHLRSAWVIAEALVEAQDGVPFDVAQVPNYGVSGLFVDEPVPAVMRFSSHAPTWHKAAGVPRDRRVVFGEMLQRRAMRCADRHFAPSRFVAGLVAEDRGIDVKVVRPPLPASVDRDRWDTEWVHQVAADAPYVVHAGQLGRAKGTDLVLEAAERFLERAPDLQLHLCGRDAGAGSLIRALRGRFTGRVRYHGKVSPDRLHPLMVGSLAVISPSRADNLPNVVIEAMSVSVPVIGVRGASIDELVEEGESGYLVAPEDGADLAAAVERMLVLPESERRSMGARARRRVLSMLDEEETLSELIELYGDLRTRGPGRRMPRHRAAARVRKALRAYGCVLRIRSGLAARWQRAAARIGGV